jgi:hypothetical protein
MMTFLIQARRRLDAPFRNRRLTPFASFLAVALGAVALGNLNLSAEDSKAARAKSETTQRRFASPADAIKALQAAVEAKDKAAMREIFGSEFNELLTGDEVLDANHARKFAAFMAQGCEPVKDGDAKITLEIGTNNWPMPIPLVKVDGQWRFDTAAGKDEIVSRHIGKDELHAIGVCRAYVTAQKQYAAMNFGGESTYARKFKSTPGKKDGLYWEQIGNEPASPFGPLVAEAHAEGYRPKKSPGPHPFHGYYFRILTRQGGAAPGGKMNYETGGNLTKGFALVAYPEYWDRSGIMTFVVNQDGKLYQKNLGDKTSRTAGSMKEYNPDGSWTLVQDEGAMSAASER